MLVDSVNAVLEYFLEWADRVTEVDVDPDAEPLAQRAARARQMLDGLPAAQPTFVVFLEALLQARRSPELHRQLAEHYAEQRRRAMQSIPATTSGRDLPPRFQEVLASYILAVIDGLQIQALLDPAAIPRARSSPCSTKAWPPARGLRQPQTRSPSQQLGQGS